MSYSFTMVGAAGRMGQSIIALSQNFAKGLFSLRGALETKGCPAIGEDAGRFAGLRDIGTAISADMAQALKGAQVAIDFSSPASSLALLEFCSTAPEQIPCVIGTTGFNSEQSERIEQAAKQIPLLMAANMSLGVNLLFHLTSLAAKLLGPGFDAEIIETHHRHKKDAPSGTALALRDALKNSERYQNYQDIYGREGMSQGRPQKEIGIHALRGGDIVGDHSIFFMGEGETLELSHRASSREAFAQGALSAALFLIQESRKPKIYNMADVLGLG